MKFDYGVEEADLKARTKYNFYLVKPGASLHVETDAERCRVLAAFRYWALQDKQKRSGAYATSAKVGEDDPRGAGYRIWFKSKRRDAERMAAQVDMPQPQQGGDADAI